MFELNDKTALVTGATGGIGGGIARALHKQGATVAISGRVRDRIGATTAPPNAGFSWRTRPSASMSRSIGTSRMAVASCLEIRASSALAVRFSLRLAPEMLSMLSRTPSRFPYSCRSCAAVLSPIPGTPGMLSEVSPFSP